jgi:hypothetical protein
MSVAVSHRVQPVSRRTRQRAVDDVALRERESALAAWRDSVEAAREASEANRRCSRRVRYEARDAVGVVLFSAGASTGLAVLITLVLALVG